MGGVPKDEKHPIYTCAGCTSVVAAHAATADCARCGGTVFTQDEDVLDTWFSSWLVPFSPMGWPETTPDLRRYHPTTLLVTGPDIIFFWLARMIMASLEFMGTVPFAQVLLNGILRDAKGQKMSKSLGNSPEPIDLMDRHGADALRFSMVMLTPPGQDTFFDEKNVETGRNFANKIWNATRLVLTSTKRDGWDTMLGLCGASGADSRSAKSAMAVIPAICPTNTIQTKTISLSGWRRRRKKLRCRFSWINTSMARTTLPSIFPSKAVRHACSICASSSHLKRTEEAL